MWLKINFKKAYQFGAAYFYAITSCLYLFSIGILQVRNRSFIYTIAGYFGLDMKKLVKPRVPCVKLAEIINEKAAVSLREVTGRSGNISLLELLVIDNLIATYQPKNIFEIGTFDGRTTFNMAANSAAAAKIYTLDLPKGQMGTTRLAIAAGDREFINKNSSGSRYEGTEESKKIVQLFGDSAVFDFSPYFKKMDMVFVDGSHAVDYVLNDSKTAMQLLRMEGGIILWHDYDGWDGVTQALNEIYTGNDVFLGLKRIEGTSLVCYIKKQRPL